MNWFYRYQQIKNLFQKPQNTKPLKWIFIYGLPRSGTTFMLTQFLKVAKRGTGDWRLHEFARAFKNAENRKGQTLDVDKLIHCFRDNLLENAPVGGGQYYDFVVKEASSSALTLKFLSRVFGATPTLKLFLYREPKGWFSSAQRKFNVNQKEAIIRYEKGLNSYWEVGGQAIEYGKQIPRFLSNAPAFKNVQTDDFKVSRTQFQQPPDAMWNTYNDFISKLKKQQ